MVLSGIVSYLLTPSRHITGCTHLQSFIWAHQSLLAWEWTLKIVTIIINVSLCILVKLYSQWTMFKIIGIFSHLWRYQLPNSLIFVFDIQLYWAILFELYESEPFIFTWLICNKQQYGNRLWNSSGTIRLNNSTWILDFSPDY